MPTISAELRKVLLDLDYADSIQVAAIAFAKDDGFHPERLGAMDPDQESNFLQARENLLSNRSTEDWPRVFDKWPWHVPG